METDRRQELIDQVRAAIAYKRALRVVGGNTKNFLGRNVSTVDALEVGAHRGIVQYEPDELVLRARAGTPLAEIEAALDAHGQMLPFEPPHFGAASTLGGTIACNLSGPRRPYAGAARDFVLGTEIINGRAECLRFGGQVMKNVAGFDVSRLMCGAFGTLGVLLEVALKVLPRPAARVTLRHEFSPDEALRVMNQWAARPLPISATAYDGAVLYTRLEGSETAVRAARQKLGGGTEQRESFWDDVREHHHGFFRDARPLWRLSVPPASPALDSIGKTFVEWNGGLRWVHSNAAPADVRRAAQQAGGHATLFRGGNRNMDVFDALDAPLMQLHRRLKAAFDPHAIFNPGRMHAE